MSSAATPTPSPSDPLAPIAARLETMLEAIRTFGVPGIESALGALKHAAQHADDLNGAIGDMRAHNATLEAAIATSSRQIDELNLENATLRRQLAAGAQSDDAKKALAERDQALAKLRAATRRAADLEAELASVTPQLVEFKMRANLLEKEVTQQRERRTRVLAVLGQQGNAPSA